MRPGSSPAHPSRALRHPVLSRLVNLVFAAVLVATAIAAIPR